jgi:hypothetical protein
MLEKWFCVWDFSAGRPTSADKPNRSRSHTHSHSPGGFEKENDYENENDAHAALPRQSPKLTTIR